MFNLIAFCMKTRRQAMSLLVDHIIDDTLLQSADHATRYNI